MAFFFRQALADFDVRMYDPHEGIKLANRFISYLEVLQAPARLPAHVQAVMVMRFSKDKTYEEIAGETRTPERTIRRWVSQGLEEMGGIIWD